MNSVWLAVLAGAATGALSGAGLGGGTLLMLYLTGFAGIAQRTAQSINLLYALAASPPALVQHLRAKRIPVRRLGLPAAVGAACALAGSLLAGTLESHLLRQLFGGLLCLVGLRELFFKEK